MFSFYRASRRLARELRAALKDRDYWRERASLLEKKLDHRSDFFIEREFKLVDRFLTSQVKTYAITDEIKAHEITAEDVKSEDLAIFLAEKKAFLVQCAKEANVDNATAVAEQDFNANIGAYILQFEQGG